MHASEVWAATALLSVPVTLAIPPIVDRDPDSARTAFHTRLRPRGHLAALRRAPGQPQVDRLRAAGACPLPARDRMARGPADGDDHEPEDQGPERERVPVADPDVIARTLAPTGVAAHGSVAFAGLVGSAGRALVGPGATIVGRFYTSGADNWLPSGLPEDPGVDFVATREFDLHSAPLHRSYGEGRTRVTGFVLTPEMPSASLVYFRDEPKAGAGYRLRPAARASLQGSLHRRPAGRSPCSVARRTKRSCPGCGQRRLVRSRVTSRARSTAWPKRSRRPGQIPRLPCCSDAHVPSGTYPTRCSSQLLRPATVDKAVSESLEARCSCVTVQEASGGLTNVPTSWLLHGTPKERFGHPHVRQQRGLRRQPFHGRPLRTQVALQAARSSGDTGRRKR